MDVVSPDKVAEMKTAGLSEHAYKLIYDNITHGKDKAAASGANEAPVNKEEAAENKE